MSNALQTFRDVLNGKGLIPAEIIADGKLHRCPTQAKPNKQNGAYIAHLDTPATLWWCNWESVEQGTFTDTEERTFSQAEKEALRQRQAIVKQQREDEFARRQAAAAQKAQSELNASIPCSPEHPYLQRKGIPPLGAVRQAPNGTLLIPVQDASGNVQTLQRIAPDGEKRFLTGGKVHGGHFVIQGKPEKAVAVCEGYATGASIHLACGYPVYVAFSANNLPIVAGAVRNAFPDKSILICGDTSVARSPGTRHRHFVCPAWHRQNLCGLERCRGRGIRRGCFRLACSHPQTDAVCGWRNARYSDAEPSCRSYQRHGGSAPCLKKSDAHHAGFTALPHAGFIHHERTTSVGTVSERRGHGCAG